MKRILFGFLVLSLCLVLNAGYGTASQSVSTGTLPLSPALRAAFGRMPLYFVENRGQLDSRVGYYVQGKDETLYFGAEGVTLALAKAADGSRWVIKLDFLGANPDIRPVGEDESGAVVSYFKDEPEKWKTGLPAYARIIYRELWPGIDLVYSGTADRLKSEFIMKPGADPTRIRLGYRGAESVFIDKEGRLEIKTPVSSFQDDFPEAWQEAGGVRRDVTAGYELAEPEAEEGGGIQFVYGFELGSYDPALPLIIDPATLVYCGYLGGSDDDYGQSIAADASNNIYVTGQTHSGATTFPVTIGPDLSYGGNQDAFVAKVNASGSALIYCGYIGGSNSENGMDIAVDGAGNAYVVGYTRSDQTTFPVTVGPDQTFNGNVDTFVAKVNAAGTALDYCGYIGGSGDDYGSRIALDGSGNAYVTGKTGSDQTTFPVVSGPDQTFNGNTDAFVAKVNPSGSALIYCGYIGGSDADAGQGIAVDSYSNAYVTGLTHSDQTTFPVIAGPDQTYNGNYDAFVAKVNAAGTALIYCGYIGGSSDDFSSGIKVDGSGNAYVVGDTFSDETTFPVIMGPDLSYNGNRDAFVAKVNAAGTALIYCGYIGGSNLDLGTDIALDGGGDTYVTGYTLSSQATFPVTVGPGLAYHGGWDAFVAEVNSLGTALVYCGYIGGSGDDYGFGIAVDGSGNAYVTGPTSSTGTTFPVVAGPDLTYNGNTDGFVAKVAVGAIRVTSPNGGETWEVGSRHSIKWLTADKAGVDKIVYSKDKGLTWKTIVFSTPDDGEYLWTVPKDVSRSVWVRVAEREGPGYDRSDKVFAIVPKPALRVVSPNGGEEWTAGTIHAVKWTWTGTVGPVKILFSIDNGLNWMTIAASTANTGSYSWKVPNKPSTKCLVRIKDASDGVPSDVSDAVFSIQAASAGD
jgi:hypothetical protein